MRRYLVVLAALGLTLAACAKSSSSTLAPPETSAPTVTPSASASGGATGTAADCAKTATFVHSGKLTIGTDDPAYPPFFEGGATKGSGWALNDPHTGMGFESSVAYAVAQQMGFTKDQVDWVKAPFNQTYAPGPKDWDFAIEQIGYNAKRAEAVDFSDSYYDVNQALVAVKGTPITTATTISDLRQYRLAAPIGTTSLTYITDVIKPTTEPGSYTTVSDTVAAINAHQVDGIVVDLPTALYMADPYVQEVKNSVVVGQFPAPTGGGSTDHMGMTFPKGGDLVPCVDLALAEMKANGVLPFLTNEWLSVQTNVGKVPVFKP
jgi:polar amino acid transport system substrate-binding protein